MSAISAICRWRMASMNWLSISLDLSMEMTANTVIVIAKSAANT
jgi:hypothetical protein